MTRKEQIQSLLNRLQEIQDKRKDLPSSIEDLLREEATNARTNIDLSPTSKAIRRITDEIVSVQKDPRIKELTGRFEEANVANDEKLLQLTEVFSEKLDGLLEEVKQSETRGGDMSKAMVQSVLQRLDNYKLEYEQGTRETQGKNSALESEIANLKNELAKMPDTINESFIELASAINENADATNEAKSAAQKASNALGDLEKRLSTRINQIQQHGGGNANRSIIVGGDKNTLQYFTDINLKAGAGTTITYTANQSTKYTDITITATGSGSGITRSVNVVNTDTNAGDTAAIDYVYVVSGTTTITLPAASGNSNLYTIKNVGTGVVSISPNGADTIDNDSSLLLPLRFTSVDLISDGTSNWNIT